MIRNDWCNKEHQWTEHLVPNDCYCLEPACEESPNSYTFNDEYGDCNNCEEHPPLCIKCLQKILNEGDKKCAVSTAL